jgi:type VI secretion system protein ImpK
MAAPPVASDPDDPFAKPITGRTFIVPKPGARGAAAVPAPAPAADGPDVAADFPRATTGLNPLVALANEVLALVPPLRATARHPDPGALKEQLSQAIRDFERRARAQGLAPERVMAARYILCTVLDEAAADTPWGGSGGWSKQSLLATFHNETFGGEKVFQLMARLAENVPANRDLLELIYACLSIGFEGRYRVASGGGAQLDAIRDRLAGLLRQARGDYPRALSEHWARIVRGRNPLASWLPLWVTGASMAGLLTLVYLGFALSLASRSDAVIAQLQPLRLVPAAPVVVAQPAPQPRLAQFLAPEIREGLVQVRDEVDRSVVTIRGDSLFAPGSSVVDPQRLPLLTRIGAALAQVPGLVIVSGHTDNQPIRTLRFPSNWELSQARATAVRPLLLAQGLPLERIRAEGRADTEPLGPNGTPEQRALNRRVEITLLVGSR